MFKRPDGNLTNLCESCLTCKVRQFSILKPCGDATLNAISRHKTKVFFKKGEFIFQVGDPFLGVHFIKSGVVKLERISSSGRPFIVKIGGRGGIIGHRERTNQYIRNYSATALSDVVTCFIPAESLNEIILNSSDLESQIMEEHLRDLTMLEQKSVDLAYKNVREKIADAILLIADIYNYPKTRKSFTIDFSRQDIANLTGTTKEQVSATLKEFAREGILKYSGKWFYFIDLVALGRMTEDA